MGLEFSSETGDEVPDLSETGTGIGPSIGKPCRAAHGRNGATETLSSRVGLGSVGSRSL